MFRRVWGFLRGRRCAALACKRRCSFPETDFCETHLNERIAAVVERLRAEVERNG